MPKSTIDTMIEDWASELGASARVSPDSAGTHEDLSGFTAGKPSHGEGEQAAPELQPPENWDPMGWLPCGHPSYQKVEGRTKRIREPGPESGPACAAGRKGDPTYQEGAWRQPVPERDRRNAQRSTPGYPGWPGLCTDQEGFYIGGVGNNCRYYHAGPERCHHHTDRQKP